MDCAGDNFFYFGYGSNLMAARIRAKNPSAVFHSIARLCDHRLGFHCHSCDHVRPWRGASATVMPSPGDHVWGVVWLIKFTDMSNLDDQESVHANIYKVSAVVANHCGANL